MTVNSFFKRKSSDDGPDPAVLHGDVRNIVLALRRRDIVVFKTAVSDFPDTTSRRGGDLYRVGTLRLTADELRAYAERIGIT